MSVSKQLYFSILYLAIVSLGYAQISEIKEIKDLKKVLDSINTMSPKTLVVFDIDDTLLTADQFMGSDKWYDWQTKPVIKDENQKLIPPELRYNKPAIYGMVDMMFELGTMSLTQEDAADIINTIDEQHDVLLLTARSPTSRGATMRELKANGIRFNQNQVADGPKVWKFEYQDRISGKNKVRSVSYIQNVFMVQGADKGKALFDLLGQKQEKYDTVILVDDKDYNLENMKYACAKHQKSFIGFHYTNIDKTITDKNRKDALNAQLIIDALLQAHFPKRYQQLNDHPSNFYVEVIHNGRYYLIGQSEIVTTFFKQHELAYSETKIGAGPNGETVVIQIDKKNPHLQKRLWQTFSEKHLSEK
ncbi:MAG: DUF2608 domain-containing protein [Lentisphaeria bacterium]|nr:DUF2608 domain-containing protein [Lentisphaeria bacterium]